MVYDPATGLQPTTEISGMDGFDQAVQFYSILYTNAGQQYSVLNPRNAYSWQYPPPNPTTYGYSVSSAPGSLASGTYYYAFTQVVKGPNNAFTQETTPTGSTASFGPPAPPSLYPYAVTSGGTTGASISGTFSGTNPDGTLYTTNVYRQSTNVPVWTLLTNLATNAVYVDNATDTSISSNQILTLNSDPPPVSSSNRGIIFNHQERIFCFVEIQNSDTGNQPQTQLWYSTLGTPWQFNELAQQEGGQVLLVGN
ncbi:MAG: hypothetical protein ACREQ5_13715, partial [Candidatus Dormibacteria bacterium]